MSQYINTMHRVIKTETDALRFIDTQVEENKEEYEKVLNVCQNCSGRIIFMGLGKTGHIGSKLAATFASLGIPSFFIHATESMHGDLGMITNQDIVILISHSGETKEILAPVRFIKQIGATTVAMTGNNNSSLANTTDFKLSVSVEKEADNLNLAPTSSSTAELALGDAMACALSEHKHFNENDFASFHPGGALGKKLFGTKE